MRFLITTEGDVEGQVLAPVCRELRQRGHDVHVYSKYSIEAFNIEFTLASIPVRPLDSLWSHEEEYDAALVYRDAISALHYHQVPMAYMVFGPNASQQRVIGAQFFLVDLMLVSGENAARNLRRNGYDGEVLVTGMPKYDPLFHMNKRSEKLIVVPDSPNCPRGQDRDRFVDILFEIARRNPDHDIWVKPRFLLGDRWQSGGFLCGYDRHMEFFVRSRSDVPENFRVLDTYYSMNELAARSALMISAPTSAILSQMVLGKPALLVEDAMRPTDLLYNAMYHANLETYGPSGCCVWMNELLDHTPKGLLPNPEWVEREVGPFDGKASARVADGLEQLAANHRRGINWLPRHDDSQEEFPARCAAYREEYRKMDGARQELEHRKALERTANRGLAALRAVAEDLGDGEDFSEEVDLFDSLLQDLLQLHLSLPEFRRVLHLFLSEIHILVDRFWNFKVNTGFFKAGFVTQAADLTYRMGMHLAELDHGVGERFSSLRRENFGYSLLDYMLEGPVGKTPKACGQIAETLFLCGQHGLSREYARSALEKGEANLPSALMEKVIESCSPEAAKAYVELWRHAQTPEDGQMHKIAGRAK